MKQYVIVIDHNHSVHIKAKSVKVKSDNSLIFYNPQDSVSAQYVYGSEVVAHFEKGAYAYFYKVE